MTDLVGRKDTMHNGIRLDNLPRRWKDVNGDESEFAEYVYVTGNLVQKTAGAGSKSTVAAANADTAILALNADRIGATIYNDSTATLYLSLAPANAAASATSFTIKMDPGGYVELPYGYTGAVRGFWDAVNGNARVTEFT